jgi:hypothetical protein
VGRLFAKLARRRSVLLDELLSARGVRGERVVKNLRSEVECEVESQDEGPPSTYGIGLDTKRARRHDFGPAVDLFGGVRADEESESVTVMRVPFHDRRKRLERARFRS